MNGNTGRCIIFCHRNFYCRIAVQAVYRLHTAFTEGFGTEKLTAFSILNSTGNNFRSAGTAMINKHGQRIFHLLQAGGFFILVAVFIYNRNNRSLRHQHTGNGNTCIKNTAGIAAQSLHALFLQLCVFFGKVITGIFIKYGYSDITDFCIRQKLTANRRIFDFATLNAHSTQFTILALELQLDDGAMLAADFVGYLLHIHITRRFSVNRSNNIATLNTSFCARIIL